MELSKRLDAVASLINIEHTLVDVGTDHGYIPIYMIEKGCQHGIAMDVNEGPLSRARDHIRAYHMEGFIETRLSNGFQNLLPGEAQTAVMAGMGGALIIKILTDYPAVTAAINEFVLQPQSEIRKVRKFLQDNHFVISEEEMVYEEGKFYPVLQVYHGEEERFSEMELRYGRRLLDKRHKVLEQFIKQEIKQKEEILIKLESQKSQMALQRMRDVVEELENCHKALKRMEK